MKKNYKTLGILTLLIILSTISLFTLFAGAKRGGEGGRGDGPIIYVEGQGLYYDSIVTADPLPQHGPFQKLYVGPLGLSTMFGPGDPGYRGGRWWLDLNGNGELDTEDKYFSCPLLGPGRLDP
jgi:hypothetical protein